MILEFAKLQLEINLCSVCYLLWHAAFNFDASQPMSGPARYAIY